jgi:hypothetical protein
LCYEAALRELVSDSLQAGRRIEVSSGVRKQFMTEYRVKLCQSFIHKTERVSDIYVIKVVSNEFPDDKTYIRVSDSYFAQ